MFKDRVIVDGVKQNTLNMDYKQSKEIRNIRKLHTCKNLNVNVLLYPRHLCRRVYSFRFSVCPFVRSYVR